jgi:hypothetical protein
MANNQCMATKKLGPISSQFISTGEKASRYKICFGKCFASSLSGFLAGIIVASLIWLLVVEAFFK